MRTCKNCGSTLDPGEVCDCQSTTIDLYLQSAPVIHENLDSIKQKLVADAARIQALPKNEESLKAIRALRAERRKEFEAAEIQRKEVKRQVMAPYLEAEQAYKERIAAPYQAFDEQAKAWVDDYESGLKSACETELREYFDQLCEARGIDFLTFEQAGVNVGLTAARKENRKKERDQLYNFVARVAEDVESIRCCQNPEEVMVEYRKNLSFAQAVFTVTERHKAMEVLLEQPVSDRETAAKNLLEERVICPFTVRATMPQLRALKAYMLANDIEILEDKKNE